MQRRSVVTVEDRVHRRGGVHLHGRQIQVDGAVVLHPAGAHHGEWTGKRQRLGGQMDL